MGLPKHWTVRDALAVVVVCTWSASMIADMFIESYDPPTALQAIVLGVAAFLWGEGRLKNGGGGER